MMDQERLRVYLHALEPDEKSLLRELELYAEANYVPIMKKETASLLKTMLEITKPKRVLEVGTAIGYSALLMAEHLDADAAIVTIEKFAKRIPIARENFKRAGEEKRITLIEGDAAQVLKELDGPFDFIFMDAAKGQYIHFLPDVLRLLGPEGVLLSDNVLQDGDILESRYAVTRRDRTIHARMREYLYVLKHTEGLSTCVLPVGDGVTISTKTKDWRNQ